MIFGILLSFWESPFSGAMLVLGSVVLLMEEILHQLIGSLSHYLQGFYTSQVVLHVSGTLGVPSLLNIQWDIIPTLTEQD